MVESTPASWPTGKRTRRWRLRGTLAHFRLCSPQEQKEAGEAADGAKGERGEAEAVAGLQNLAGWRRRKRSAPRSGALRRAAEAYLAGASRAQKGVTQGGKHMPAAIAQTAAAARILKDVAGRKAADKRTGERIPAASTTPCTASPPKEGRADASRARFSDTRREG